MTGMTGLRIAEAQTNTKATPAEHDTAWQLFHDNFRFVLCESDRERRLAAIDRLWVRYPLIYDDDHAVAGAAAVMAAADRLLTRLGPRICNIECITAGDDGMFLIRWRSAASEGYPEIGGCHLAVIDGNRLDSLFLLETSGPAAPPRLQVRSARARNLMELGPTAP